MRTFLLCIALIWAHAAQAEVKCNFTAECMAGEACADTTFSLAYQVTTCPRAPGPRGISAVADFGDLSGIELDNGCSGTGPEVANRFALSGDGATYLLTLHGSDARLSVHMDGPMAITYQGTCEAEE